MTRLRFRIHSLLIVVALIACWLAWQSRIVGERRAKLAWIVDGRAAFVLTVEDATPSGADLRLSFWRRWMGDMRVDRLMLFQEHVSASDVEEIRAIFPEADVQVMTLSDERANCIHSLGAPANLRCMVHGI